MRLNTPLNKQILFFYIINIEFKNNEILKLYSLQLPTKYTYYRSLIYITQIRFSSEHLKFKKF